MPDDGLTLDAVATNCVIRPVAGLPALHDADLTVHIVGRDAQIAVGKATADLPSGRKLVLSSGLFEVPDTAPHAPPARVHFKLDGPVPAAAELLAMDRLRDVRAGAVRSGDDPRHYERAGRSGDAAQARPAAGIDQLRHHRRRHELFRRTHDHGAEGRGRGPESQRQQPGLSRSRATSRSAARRPVWNTGRLRGDSEADVHIQGMLDEAMRNNLGPRSVELDQRRHSDRHHRPRRHDLRARRPLLG